MRATTNRVVLLHIVQQTAKGEAKIRPVRLDRGEQTIDTPLGPTVPP